jgi:hypothetical protein
MVTWFGKGPFLDMKNIAVIQRYEVESFILTEEVGDLAGDGKLYSAR